MYAAHKISVLHAAVFGSRRGMPEFVRGELLDGAEDVDNGEGGGGLLFM